MSVLGRIRAAIDGFRTGVTTRRVPDWPDWIIGHPFIPPEILDEDFKDAFRKVPIVAAAIGRVQHDVAALPMRVWRGKGDRRVELERKPGNLVDLLNRANPWETGYQLRVATVGNLKTHGNAYWFLQMFGGQRAPAEVWNLYAHLMEVVPGENRTAARYYYNRGGKRSEIAPESIIHFRKYNPDDHPVGMSELEPVRKAYEAQFYAFIWLKEFMRKGGMISGVWSVKDAGRKFTTRELEAMMERLKKLHVGFDKAWDPVVIESLEFVKRGMTLSEMELDTHLNMLDAKICRAVGVPPWMMGIKEGSTLGTSGAEVDATDYVEGTLKREAKLIDSTLTEQLAPLFGDDLEVETDFTGTLAATKAMLEQAKSLVSATGRAIMTVNEARRRLNLEEHEDPTADELFTKPEPAFGEPGAPGEKPGGNRELPSARKLPAVRAMIEGDERREQLRRRAATALERAEARMLRFLTQRLEEQERQVLRRLKERWERENPSLAKARLAIDLGGLMDESDDEDEARVRRILTDLLRQRGREAVTELSELVEIGHAVAINLQSERVQRFLDAQVDRAIIVPDGTTAEALRSSLAEGVAGNESLAELAARVRSVFQARENMAATIARTETLPGFNLATQEAWLESGVVEGNEWLTARDSAVREAHSLADGDQVRLGEPFTVDGEPLMYPGDPSGSAGNVINCRCTMLPIIMEEALESSRWRFMAHQNGHKPNNRLKKYMGEKSRA